jgi:REP element-mobilizing transposase RayT
MTFPSYQDPTHLYFVTATVCGWRRLFDDPAAAKIVLDSLTWMRQERRILLFAFALLPSHLHILLKPERQKVGEILQDFGSFTAHCILAHLRTVGHSQLMNYFSLPGET